MITKTTTSPFKKANGDIVARDTSAKLGIGLTSPVGSIDVDMGSSGFCTTEITLDDDGTVAAESVLPGSLGWIWISEIFQSVGGFQVFGSVFIKGPGDAVTEISDPVNKIYTSSGTEGSLNIYADGDSTYSIENKLNRASTFALMYLGED